MTHLKGTERALYVRSMFARIAQRYDLMNRLMSVGQDGAWRKLVVRAAQLRPGSRIMDVATGTGDMMIEALRQQPNTLAVGSDFTFEMMQVGQQKPASNSIRWCAADALNLPFADDSFDAVTSGFGVRNFIDRVQAFREQRRVLRPGGRVICLEISKPPRNLLAPLFRLYFNRFVPLAGGIISGQRDAYTYLPQSVNEFLTPEELKVVMETANLREVTYQRLMLGSVAIHVGMK
jgi:demethylmenaquinone methyltransferase / 2-methoxy-6-polyprenyl-1,4-benzoquinol methylase